MRRGPRPYRRVIVFLLQHLLLGLAAAVIFGGVILYKDIAHLRSLTMDSADGGVALTLLFFGLFVTFGSLSMVIGIMGEADHSQPPDDIRS